MADSGPLYSDVLLCVTNIGPTAQSFSEAPNPACSNPFAVSVYYGPCVFANFSDGESMAPAPIIPDDNGAGDSDAQNVLPTLYKQAFTCQATVGVGASDSTADNIKNQDSVEFYVNYPDYDGHPVSSITTACIGEVPAGVTINTSAPVTHLVGCSEYNPFVPGGYVQGLGISGTFPDRQYGEICNVPNYPVSQPPA